MMYDTFTFCIINIRTVQNHSTSWYIPQSVAILSNIVPIHFEITRWGIVWGCHLHDIFLLVWDKVWKYVNIIYHYWGYEMPLSSLMNWFSLRVISNNFELQNSLGCKYSIRQSPARQSNSNLLLWQVGTKNLRRTKHNTAYRPWPHAAYIKCIFHPHQSYHI